MILCVVALWLGVSVVVAGGETLRVPSVHSTINDALDASAPGDTVLVAPGTYNEADTRSDLGVNTTAIAFMQSGVVLRSESGATATTLSLDRGGAQRGRVVYATGLTAPCSIEGFSMEALPGYSGVLMGYSEELTVKDCVFRNLGGSGASGGISAVLMDLVVEGCTFESCVSGSGGAIDQLEGRIWIESSVFRNCSDQAIDLNGLVSSTQGAVIRDCVFENNFSSFGGGAIAINDYLPDGLLLERCLFVGNVGETQGGGAIEASGFGAKTIRDCVFVGNHSFGSGGAVTLGTTPALIVGSSFWGNSNDQGTGSAIRLSTLGQNSLQKNIIASNDGSVAVSITNGTIASSCNVFWSNAAGDASGFTLDVTDRIIDPELCDPENGDLTLQSTSPCLPEHSDGCGLIGALGVGCGTVSITAESWGSIKSHYR